MDINMQQVEEQKKQLAQNMKSFLQSMKIVDNYHMILENIFDSHFKFDDSSVVIKNLGQHLTEVFKNEGFIIIDYMQYGDNLSLSEIGLDVGAYKQAMECITRIKYKYGFIIRELIKKNQVPFLINSVETNVNTGSNFHGIKISRVDEQYISGLVDAETMMNIISGLTVALKMVMEKGIYNYNDFTVKNYLNVTEEFKNNLNIIIKDSSEEIQKSIAAAKVD